MSKLTKKDIKAIEELGWSVTRYDDYYELSNYSDAGGDMTFEAETKEEIVSYCENYDADEEFRVWYGQKRGEPSLPSELWQDCLNKGEMYQKLKDVLTETE